MNVLWLPLLYISVCLGQFRIYGLGVLPSQGGSLLGLHLCWGMLSFMDHVFMEAAFEVMVNKPFVTAQAGLLGRPGVPHARCGLH